jgi:ABC-type Mn2+/Zn2+ transport system ATPase subunit
MLPSRNSSRFLAASMARLQILLLELSGATLLLLDEPTDNLDLVSAEALEEGFTAHQCTVLAVTHDRWFARSFDRSFDQYLVFGADGVIYEAPEPVWDEGRVEARALTGQASGTISRSVRGKSSPRQSRGRPAIRATA